MTPPNVCYLFENPELRAFDASFVRFASNHCHFSSLRPRKRNRVNRPICSILITSYATDGGYTPCHRHPISDPGLDVDVVMVVDVVLDVDVSIIYASRRMPRVRCSLHDFLSVTVSTSGTISASARNIGQMRFRQEMNEVFAPFRLQELNLPLPGFIPVVCRSTFTLQSTKLASHQQQAGAGSAAGDVRAVGN
jgi:hypothetical protein